jgi:signal transduction histidine kinase
MNRFRNRRRAILSWLSVSTLLVLCGILGVLQYRWIGEVSVAAGERLRGSLQASLKRLSQDFNAEITVACMALMPRNLQTDGGTTEEEYATRYARWRHTSPHEQLFRTIALAELKDDRVVLRKLDLDKGVFETAEWPEPWKGFENRLEARLSNAPWSSRRPPEPSAEDQGLLFELPHFRRPQPSPPSGPAPGPPSGPSFGPPSRPPAEPGRRESRFGQRETEWLLLEVNPEYIRDVMLPALVQRHLGSGGRLDYQVEVVTKAPPQRVIYQSEPDAAKRIAENADGSVRLFELQYDRLFRRVTPPGTRDRGPSRFSNEDLGRWQMFVRHRAGSVEAAVSRARWRNLGVTAGILLLMVATMAALIRFTRSAQKLAELQINFVAGVSHELRTPLTVIRTAAYNLRGKLANNPNQVERYGALIQQECERLTDLVEQVLQFASAKAGRVVRESEPLSMEGVIEDVLESCKSVVEASRCVVEKAIEPDLPLVLGDSVALKHALQNLLSNAIKYGTEGNNWVGVSASKSTDQAFVEIRVADHGPGIPADELEHIFDPFFRGKRALQDQIRGSGLGLSLVKGIIESHGGTIAVSSRPGEETEFMIRIPAAPAEYQDEFAHSFSRG